MHWLNSPDPVSDANSAFFPDLGLMALEQRLLLNGDEFTAALVDPLPGQYAGGYSVVVEFSEAVAATDIETSDVVFNGANATDIDQISDTRLRFSFNDQSIIDGPVDMSISAAAFESVAGNTISAYEAGFTLDTISPELLYITASRRSDTDGDITTFALQFNEEVVISDGTEWDEYFHLQPEPVEYWIYSYTSYIYTDYDAELYRAVEPSNFWFDADTCTLNIEYQNLLEQKYEFEANLNQPGGSTPGWIYDRAGNAILQWDYNKIWDDGDSHGVDIDYVDIEDYLHDSKMPSIESGYYPYDFEIGNYLQVVSLGTNIYSQISGVTKTSTDSDTYFLDFENDGIVSFDLMFSWQFFTDIFISIDDEVVGQYNSENLSDISAPNFAVSAGSRVSITFQGCGNWYSFYSFNTYVNTAFNSNECRDRYLLDDCLVTIDEYVQAVNVSTNKYTRYNSEYLVTLEAGDRLACLMCSQFDGLGFRIYNPSGKLVFDSDKTVSPTAGSWWDEDLAYDEIVPWWDTIYACDIAATKSGQYTIAINNDTPDLFAHNFILIKDTGVNAGIAESGIMILDNKDSGSVVDISSARRVAGQFENYAEGELYQRSRAFKFSASAGDELTVTALAELGFNPGDLDLSVAIYDPFGRAVAFGSDGESGDAVATGTAQADGVYTAWLTANSGYGDYFLSLTGATGSSDEAAYPPLAIADISILETDHVPAGDFTCHIRFNAPLDYFLLPSEPLNFTLVDDRGNETSLGQLRYDPRTYTLELNFGSLAEGNYLLSCNFVEMTYDDFVELGDVNYPNFEVSGTPLGTANPAVLPVSNLLFQNDDYSQDACDFSNDGIISQTGDDAITITTFDFDIIQADAPVLAGIIMPLPGGGTTPEPVVTGLYGLDGSAIQFSQIFSVDSDGAVSVDLQDVDSGGIVRQGHYSAALSLSDVADEYLCELNAGDYISVFTNNPDITVTLLRSGSEIAAAEGNLNAFKVEDDGEYSIVLTGDSCYYGVEFVVNAALVGGLTSGGAADSAIALEAYKIPVSNDISDYYVIHGDSADEYYKLTVNAGDVLNIATELATVSLLGGDLSPLCVSHGDIEGFVIPQSGDYYIMFSGGVSGELCSVRLIGVGSAAVPQPPAAASPQSDIIQAGQYTELTGSVIIDFVNPVRLDTLDAADLLINGHSCGGFTVVDAGRISFDLTEYQGDGDFTLEIPAGAVTDIFGQSFGSYSVNYSVDATAPVVVSSSVQAGGMIAPGADTETTSFVIKFSEAVTEPLAEHISLERSDFGSDVFSDVDFTFVYDSDEFVLTVSALNSDLITGNYRLTLDDAISDSFGNALDGETPGWPIPVFTSGDGATGGDFSVSFAVDDADQQLRPQAGPLDYAWKATVADSLNFDGDVDSYKITLGQDETISIMLHCDDNIAPWLKITDSAGYYWGIRAQSLGESHYYSYFNVPADGEYSISVLALNGASGDYQLTTWLNSRLDSGPYQFGYFDNSKRKNAFDIDSNMKEFCEGGYFATHSYVDGHMIPGWQVSGINNINWTQFKQSSSDRISINSSYIYFHSRRSGHSSFQAMAAGLVTYQATNYILDFMYEGSASESRLKFAQGTGVLISLNAKKWFRAWQPEREYEDPERVRIDVAEVLASYGKKLGDVLYIALEHQGDSHDDSYFHNFTAGPIAEDWYSLSLSAGETVNIQAKLYDRHNKIDIMSPDGQTVTLDGGSIIDYDLSAEKSGEHYIRVQFRDDYDISVFKNVTAVSASDGEFAPLNVYEQLVCDCNLYGEYLDLPLNIESAGEYFLKIGREDFDWLDDGGIDAIILDQTSQQIATINVGDDLPAGGTYFDADQPGQYTLRILSESASLSYFTAMLMPAGGTLGYVYGVKFVDNDVNGHFGEPDAPVEGWGYYLDTNENGQLDAGETVAYTDQNGFFEMEVPCGAYQLRQLPLAGWQSDDMDSARAIFIEPNGTYIELSNAWQQFEFSGRIWYDSNSDTVIDPEESPLEGWTVYIDRNFNGLRDSDEEYVLTDSDGRYSFGGIRPAHISVRMDCPAGYISSGLEYETVLVGTSQPVEPMDFGFVQEAAIAGRIWYDINSDQVMNAETYVDQYGHELPGESYCAGLFVYADTNLNGQYDFLEPYDYVDSEGSYAIDGLVPGEYVIGISLKQSLYSTAQTSGKIYMSDLSQAVKTVTAVGGEQVEADFAVIRADYADAKNPFKVNNHSGRDYSMKLTGNGHAYMIYSYIYYDDVDRLEISGTDLSSTFKLQTPKSSSYLPASIVHIDGSLRSFIAPSLSLFQGSFIVEEGGEVLNTRVDAIIGCYVSMPLSQDAVGQKFTFTGRFSYSDVVLGNPVSMLKSEEIHDTSISGSYISTIVSNSIERSQINLAGADAKGYSVVKLTTAQGIIDSDFNFTGAIGKLSGESMQADNISAAWIDNQNVRQDITGSSFTLSGANSKGYSLGKLVADGQFEADIFASGSIASVAVGAMTDSDIRVGVDSGLDGFLSSSDDFINPLAAIGSIKIRGRKGYADGVMFSGTHIAAPTIDKVALKMPYSVMDYSITTGSVDGEKASIGSLSILDGSRNWKWGSKAAQSWSCPWSWDFIRVV